MERVIVSRHRATIEWIARQLQTEGIEARHWPDGIWCPACGFGRICPATDDGIPRTGCPACSLDGRPAVIMVIIPLIALAVRPDVDRSFGKPGQIVKTIPVITDDATADDVRGKIVYGNLPYHLAVHAAEVHPVQFRGQLPRGADYTVEQMEAAGVHLGSYHVIAV